jgi:hypothetical protein
MANVAVLGNSRVYEIKVEGRLDESWPDWFGRLAITSEGSNDGEPTTTLRGSVVDQTELRGILDSLWNLNLVLVSAIRIQQHDGIRYRAPSD